MNLVNTFARIKKLFFRREGKLLRLVELNGHLQRDLGLDHLTTAHHTHDSALPKKDIIIHGHFTRAP